MEFLKFWWMLWWRMSIVALFWEANLTNGSPSSGIAGAFGASLAVALVIHLALKKSLRAFPLIRLVARKPVIISLDSIGEPVREDVSPRESQGG